MTKRKNGKTPRPRSTYRAFRRNAHRSGDAWTGEAPQRWRGIRPAIVVYRPAVYRGRMYPYGSARQGFRRAV